MRRRDLLTALVGAAVLAPLGGIAQQPVTGKRMWRVGLLSNGPHQAVGWRTALLQVLGQAGFRLDNNLELIERYSEGNIEQLPQLAREIGEADAIMAISQAAVIAAAATKTSPIVSVGSDPVVNGLADGYAHPGGRVTGITFRTTETDPKRLQLLSEAIPGARHFGYLGMAYQVATPLPQEMAQAAARVGVELIAQWVEGPADYGHHTQKRAGQAAVGGSPGPRATVSEADEGSEASRLVLSAAEQSCRPTPAVSPRSDDRTPLSARQSRAARAPTPPVRPSSKAGSSLLSTPRAGPSSLAGAMA